MFERSGGKEVEEPAAIKAIEIFGQSTLGEGLLEGGGGHGSDYTVVK